MFNISIESERIFFFIFVPKSAHIIPQVALNIFISFLTRMTSCSKCKSKSKKRTYTKQTISSQITKICLLCNPKM